MRKICSECGLINYSSDDACRRCGAALPGQPNPMPRGVDERNSAYAKRLSILAYILCFICAIGAEFLACLPVLANLGWRHSASAGVTQSELDAQFWLFVLHLPSSAVPWAITRISEIFDIFYIVVPFTQVVFWTVLFAFLWGRLKRFINA